MKKRQTKKYHPINNPSVKAVFETYPSKARKKLMDLRQLILDEASKHPEVGKLEEALRWEQPSYLTSETKSGSTIRLDKVRGSESEYAIYFNCKTTLIETCRAMFPKKFRYEGNRAIIFNIEDRIPKQELQQIVYEALTYHLNKK